MSARTSIAFVILSATLTFTAQAAPPARQQLQITGYVISADLDPAVNRLTATADVTFTALEDLTTVVLELNNGLHIASITGPGGVTLSSERFANEDRKSVV